jgi:hypothetical protein
VLLEGYVILKDKKSLFGFFGDQNIDFVRENLE